MANHIPKIRSRHGSHDTVRGVLEPLPFRSVVRFGSTTPTANVYPLSVLKGLPIVEINTVDAVKNSASKLLMKQCFTAAGVITAKWFIKSVLDNHLVKVIGIGEDSKPVVVNDDITYPIIAKHHFGSRGTGNYKLNSADELQRWMQGKDLSKYLFEEYLKGMDREYRLHVNKNGCFYTCRKMLKENTPDANRWYRNDSNSVWIVEENEKFDKPINWTAIEAECVKALLAVGLDVAAFDVKVQTSKDKESRVRPNPKFSIIECNSAPSFGEITSKKYMEMLPTLLKQKFING